MWELKIGWNRLGLDKGEAFESSLEEIEVKMESGSLFVIYSDGISEAMNEKQEEFGEERIIKVLKGNSKSSVDTIQKKLLSGIVEFCGNVEQHDDITLLLVKFSWYFFCNKKTGWLAGFFYLYIFKSNYKNHI